MKNFKYFAFAAALAVGLVSCSSSDDNDDAGSTSDITTVTPSETSTFNVAKNAELYAYSNENRIYGVGESTRAEEETVADATTEETTETVAINDTLEVNLSMNRNLGEATNEDGTTYDKDYIQTKLSVHVREVTDIEVTIPVAAEYYVEDYDEYINFVGQHKTDAEISNALEENTKEMTYSINGNNVTLTVEYEADAVVIKSEGINESVISYLRDTYQDGLTFEVYLYNKSTYGDAEATLTRAALGEMLDGSKIETTQTVTNVKTTIVESYLEKEYDENGKIKLYDKDGNAVTYYELSGYNEANGNPIYTDILSEEEMAELHDNSTIVENVDPVETTVVLDRMVSWPDYTNAVIDKANAEVVEE